MYVVTTVGRLEVGDRIMVPLGPVEVTHLFRIDGLVSIGQSDTGVLWRDPNSPIEVYREEIQ